MTIALEPKRADEKRRYRHDWSPFLGEDTIASQTTTSEDVTIDDSDIDVGEQSVTFIVSGGENGTVATITHSIVTATGDEETEIFVLEVGLGEPVSLSEAKAQVRMAQDDSEDAFIASLITPARAYVERVSRFNFVAGARTETFTQWGDYLEIWRRPISAVGPAIAYTNEAGTEADYEAFRVRGTFPLRIYPAVDGSFPALADGGTITVPYTAGQVDPTSEEYLIGKRAMLLLIGHWFEFREAAASGIVSSEIAFAVSSLLDELRPVPAY